MEKCEASKIYTFLQTLTRCDNEFNYSLTSYTSQLCRLQHNAFAFKTPFSGVGIPIAAVYYGFLTFNQGLDMKKSLFAACAALFLMVIGEALAAPTVFPTGVTIYNPEKCYNGYTLLNVLRATPFGLPLIDMNGTVVNKWMRVEGQPAKLLSNGNILAEEALYDPEHWADRLLEGSAVVEKTWDDKVVWRWDHGQQIPAIPDLKTKGQETMWSAQQHHDLQREGMPVYYTPETKLVEGGKTLIQCHEEINGEDNAKLVIVDKDGKELWKWVYADHAKAMKGIANFQNCASWIGPNKWYDAGDKRFHPENIICGDGQAVIYILDHVTGNPVWKIGPEYDKDSPLRHLGMHLPEGGYRGLFGGGMIHHAHMIPHGLPGAGNIMVFNNGLPYSEVIEFDPTTGKKVWEYSGQAIGYGPTHSLAHYFFSASISSAQRLPNGNTLICEGDGGRIFEVTPDLETVWEYVTPYIWYGMVSGFNAKELQRKDKKVRPTNSVYRAERYPYDYIRQVKAPEGKPIEFKDPFLYDSSMQN